MKLLLTGFEPFGGSSMNPSQQIVQTLQSQTIAGVDLRTTILPVDGERAAEMAIAALQAHRPDAVVCLGQAARRPALSIERVAINLRDYTIPDNAGTVVADEPVVADGPAAYFVTLPVRALLAAIKAAGVPAELSLSAGTYVCNQVLYALLHHIAVNKLEVPAGFVHVPLLPEQAASLPSTAPSMGLEAMARGISAAIEELHRII